MARYWLAEHWSAGPGQRSCGAARCGAVRQVRREAGMRAEQARTSSHERWPRSFVNSSGLHESHLVLPPSCGRGRA
jgi:hypothetical protein